MARTTSLSSKMSASSSKASQDSLFVQSLDFFLPEISWLVWHSESSTPRSTLGITPSLLTPQNQMYATNFLDMSPSSLTKPSPSFLNRLDLHLLGPVMTIF